MNANAIFIFGNAPSDSFAKVMIHQFSKRMKLRQTTDA